MHVLIVTPWFPHFEEDQRGNYIWDSVKSLLDEGVQVDILWLKTWRFCRKDQINHSFLPANFCLKSVRYFSLPRHFLRCISNYCCQRQAGTSIKQMHKKRGYDLIQVHTEICAVGVYKVAKKLGVPIVATLHGIEQTARLWEGLSGKMIKRALSLVDRVILVGEPLCEHFSRFSDTTAHFRVVYNGFRWREDMNNAKAAWGETVKIISVSNLLPGKGIDTNIAALARLQAEGITNWHYTIVGGGCQRNQLEQMAKKLGIDEKVTFAGSCAHDRVYDLLKVSDVFSLPSSPEAFGIAYLEAMAFGLLAIGVIGQGPSAFIKNGVTGYLLSGKNISELVIFLRKILLNEEVAQQIAEKGRVDVLNGFTWRHHAKNLIEVYGEAC